MDYIDFVKNIPVNEAFEVGGGSGCDKLGRDPIMREGGCTILRQLSLYSLPVRLGIS